MTFRHLALKNIKGNWYQYIAFFLSCTFSVMIFYIFASFIYHPDVVNGHIEGGEKVRSALLACEYIIMIFSFFFVLYSESAFVKSRKKEFGLLSLFGMTNGQIRKLVFYENMLIACFAILSGMALGTLFSKLFLMAMSELLHVDSPIGFQIVTQAVVYTIVGFLALFLVITIYSLFRLGKNEIIELLKASQKPKSLPLFSKWLVVFSMLTLALGYGMAYFSGLRTVMIFMFPILGLVIVGTYFLFTQGSVALFRNLRRRTSVYYKRTNLITLSQLIFKMKDNARVLFMVSILSAVVLTASGMFYIFFQGSLHNVTSQYPQTFSYVEKGLNSHEVLDPDQIDQILADDGVNVKYKNQVAAAPVTVHLSSGKTTMNVVSNMSYNQEVQKVKGTKKQDIEEGHAVYVYNGPNIAAPVKKNETVKAKINGEQVSLHVDKITNKSVAKWPTNLLGYLIVNDQQYESMTASVPDSEKRVAYGYELEDWASTQETIEKIKSTISDERKDAFSAVVGPYSTAKQFGSLTMFIGLFVSVLFFIAAGSMIYFKLFTELQDDQMQFRSLKRIGMTDVEIKKIVTRQIAMLFFVPFVVGGVHALFAFKMLQNMEIFGNVWMYGGIVIGIFFVMQLFYFFISRQSYLARIIK